MHKGTCTRSIDARRSVIPAPEASLSNSLQRSLHISGLKHEQKLCLVTLAHKRDVFGILPTGFGKGLIFFSIYLFSYTTQVNSAFRALRRLAFTGDGVVVGVVIRCVERYDQVKIQVTESVAEHRF